MTAEFDALRRATPARLGVGHAGARYTTAAMLKFRADHARAVDAVTTEVPRDWPKRHGLIEFASEAVSRDEYLRFPERGRRLRKDEIARLKRLAAEPKKTDGGAATKATVLLCVGDGLSSAAVVAHAPALIRALEKILVKQAQILPTIFIRNARVRIEDHLGAILRPDVVCMIVGERPGLATAESLSAYVIYKPTLKSLEPERTVISNVHPGGIQIGEGAKLIADLIGEILTAKASGAELAARRAAMNPDLA
jgi:ethanolamine ammonia-lyase small subunit